MSTPRVLVLKDGDASLHESLLAAAHSMTDVVEVLQPHAGAQDAAQLAGCITAWWNEHPCDLDTLLLVAASAGGVELAALLAAATGGTSMGVCMQVQVDQSTLSARKSACGGRAVATLTTDRWPCFAALRPAPATHPVGATKVHQLPVPGAAKFAAQPLPAADTQRALTGARVVVSGGRGMAGPEGFALLTQLAAHLDAALGGSLPTVDAGWVPVARQVGQSGKFVAPRAYVAVGISGTPQHMAGVSQESRIIAINKDADAPIFQFAEVGVVGEWQEILPLVLERLEA
jgi:electron transfer flavoprotein alpha subunit